MFTLVILRVMIRRKEDRMQTQEFNQFFQQFQEADLEEKIDLYCTTVNLTEDQYKALLRTFPPSGIKKLEKALK